MSAAPPMSTGNVVVLRLDRHLATLCDIFVEMSRSAGAYLNIGSGLKRRRRSHETATVSEFA